VILVGDELLEGRVSDANLCPVARALGEMGLRVSEGRIAPDEPAAIASALAGALGESRLVVTTGGLGPTDDDLTVAAVAAALGLPLEESPEAAACVKAWYAARGAACPPSAMKQAILPRGATAVPNPAGVAPGVVILTDGRAVICLPGVPREVEALLPACLAAAGIRRMPAAETALLRTWGIPENRLYDLISSSGVCAVSDLAFLPRPGLVDIKFRGADSSKRAGAVADLLPGSVYSTVWKSLEETVGDALSADNLILSVAESCTGGLLGGRLTSVAGSSDWFAGGVVAYSNYLKRSVLKVGGDILAGTGAVSGECARAMAAGARALTGSDCAVAVTGIAGPGGATPAKPVGTVWIAVETPSGSTAREWRFGGARQVVREAACSCALGMVLAALGADAG